MFSYGDLKAATKNFKSDALIGEGGFGKVYKGWLDEETLTPSKPGYGIIVAIKKLKPDSMQGVQEWQVTFTSYHHAMIIYVYNVLLYLYTPPSLFPILTIETQMQMQMHV